MRLSTKLFVSLATLAVAVGTTLAADNPYLGSWELRLPHDGVGWLGVQEQDGQLHASMLWVAGSVTPLDSAKLEDGKLVLTRKHEGPARQGKGKQARSTITETITATAEGDTLKLVSSTPRSNGRTPQIEEFTGKRTPPMPPAPDLSQVKFGPPIVLFDGKDLKGWRLTNPRATSGWSVKDGILVNEVEHGPGEPHHNYGNLRTDRVFSDFNLKLETRVPKDGNSGVYIRGMYEVQVLDSYGKPLDPHNMGAIYSRIKPTVNAEKPAGEWQTLDITFVDQHATVILNGTKIIDNQPVEGCTGGALSSDISKPGPLYLQGDHTSIEYRNIVLRPVEK